MKTKEQAFADQFDLELDLLQRRAYGQNISHWARIALEIGKLRIYVRRRMSEEDRERASL